MGKEGGRGKHERESRCSCRTLVHSSFSQPVGSMMVITGGAAVG